jgi:hypothetical protein
MELVYLRMELVCLRTRALKEAVDGAGVPEVHFVDVAAARQGEHLHSSAFVSIRQHSSACVSIRQHTSAYVSIRQHTSAYVSM